MGTERILAIVAMSVGVAVIAGLSFVAGYGLAPTPTRYHVAPYQSIEIPIDGKMVTVPDGYEIVYETDSKEEVLAVVADIKKSGEATGPAAYESGSSIKADWTADGLTQEIDGISSSGGAVKAKMSAFGGANAVTILTVMGGLAFIGGWILAIRGPRKIGIGLIVGGLLTLAAVFFPWLLLIVGALAIAGVVYVIWRTAKTRRIETELAEKDVTVKAIVTGIENSDASPKGSSVKKAIDTAAKTLGVKGIVDRQVDKRKTAG